MKTMLRQTMVIFALLFTRVGVLSSAQAGVPASGAGVPVFRAGVPAPGAGVSAPSAGVPSAFVPADTTARTRPFRMALKTNLLYDALAVPNIGVEIPMGKEWSVAADWMYAWWNNDRKHRCWRIYGGDLAVRYWFGRKTGQGVLTGHHLGVYGQVFTYDFSRGEKGYMGGKPGGSLWERMNYAAGVEYGYSLPVARRLHLDFSIGIGYWGGMYYTYIPLDGHYVWQTTRHRKWFGPTQAEVSLVWLLGAGWKREQKGGRK